MSRCACCTGGCSGRGPGRGHPALRRSADAYAGWTAYPAALSTGQQSTVARQCEEWTEESITKAPTQVVLSERRGGIGLALLSGPGGLLVTCQRTLGGSASPAVASETYLTDIPARDEILSDGGSGFSEDDGEPIYRVVSGRVGADVTGVVVHTAEQGDVIASVEGGYFTAWWPGPAESASPSHGVFADGLHVHGATAGWDDTESDTRPDGASRPTERPCAGTGGHRHP